jgi:ParB family chromosome partitioning protein
MEHPMSRPNALGRGLGALIPGVAQQVPTPEAPPADAGLQSIPVDAIDPNPEQPRRVFDPEQIQSLADSIRRHGVLQPVVVRRAGDRYELVVGERRWRASREAGLATLPAIIADLADRARLEVALVENVQRRDLNPIELAHAFRALGEAGATQEEIGDRVGLDRSTVSNHLRLLDLSNEMQADIETGRIGTGHAKALLQIANPERRRHLRDRIVSDSLSVRASEELAQLSGAKRPRKSTTPRAASDPNLQRLIDGLRQRLQTRVRIQGHDARGRIEIEYFGADDLQRLAGILLGDA